MNEILDVLVCLNEDISTIKKAQLTISKIQNGTNEAIKSTSVSISNINGDCLRISSNVVSLRKDIADMSLQLHKEINILLFTLTAVAVVLLLAIYLTCFRFENNIVKLQITFNKQYQTIAKLMLHKTEFWWDKNNKQLYFRDKNVRIEK